MELGLWFAAMSTELPPRVRRRPSRSSSILGLVVALFATAVVPTLIGVADAADGRVIEMSTPVPERGYFLPGEQIGFEVQCLEGESYDWVWLDEIGGSGWAGSSGWGQSIDPYAPPGTYEWVIQCTDPDGRVVDSETFTTEIGWATSLVATVGTTAGECADTREITVEAGTEVHWCYQLVPHPDLEDDIFHDWGWTEIRQQVSDLLNGALGEDVQDGDATLPAEGITSIELGFLSSSVISEDVENTGTWSVTFGEYDDEDGWERYPMADVSATARVLVVETPQGPDVEPGEHDGASVAPPAVPVTASPTYTG